MIKRVGKLVDKDHFSSGGVIFSLVRGDLPVGEEQRSLSLPFFRANRRAERGISLLLAWRTLFALSLYLSVRAEKAF